MIRTIWAFIRIAFYMVRQNPKLRLVRRLDREGNIAERDRIVNEIVPAWARYVFEVTKSDVTVEGLEKLPAGRAVVFIANHQGEMDIPLIDLTTPFLVRTDYFRFICRDGIHPNAEGHKLMAEALMAQWPW